MSSQLSTNGILATGMPPFTTAYLWTTYYSRWSSESSELPTYCLLSRPSLSEPLVSVWILLKADAKAQLDVWEIYWGETPNKEKERSWKRQEDQRRWCDNRSRSQSDASVALKMEKGHKLRDAGYLWKLGKVRDRFSRSQWNKASSLNQGILPKSLPNLYALEKCSI